MITAMEKMRSGTMITTDSMDRVLSSRKPVVVVVAVVMVAVVAAVVVVVVAEAPPPMILASTVERAGTGPAAAPQAIGEIVVTSAVAEVILKDNAPKGNVLPTVEAAVPVVAVAVAVVAVAAVVAKIDDPVAVLVAAAAEAVAAAAAIAAVRSPVTDHPPVTDPDPVINLAANLPPATNLEVLNAEVVAALNPPAEAGAAAPSPRAMEPIAVEAAVEVAVAAEATAEIN